ncbi:regulator of chromosome condensation (RCC1) repeat family protein [Carpediemonas membranifera]|uniref:Regulator of chromosome condensation (RCC1) repeat family protein n=1 Tax=Carpediemonas membranifera TaxID=201153 RepID=A0A8J6AV01_9EUKA|nr:regulator of chromosome condensation (RCC1) repeat family protein [Carpediemonas membranifera]|eukprot:KAG9394858.1 regulator of chromosome condensation (RCC1) repeat family protein [Carpediemonas membranifera]
MMPSPQTLQPTNEQLLRRLAVSSQECTQNVSGNIPALLQTAYWHETSGRSLPRTLILPSKAYCCEKRILQLVTDLSSLSAAGLTNPRAKTLIDRAITVLRHGAPQSMNIPISPGQELPDTVYTLLQGTCWATLMSAGADPDLASREHAARCGKTGPATQNKCLWFLCKKFFFALNIGEKDGHAEQVNDKFSPVFFRRYANRLFARGNNEHSNCGVLGGPTIPTYQWVRVPPVIELHTVGTQSLAVTPRGMYGWGSNRHFNFGLGHNDSVCPTRLTFPDVPRVAQFEERLGGLERHGLVTSVFLSDRETMIVTPVGTLVSGDNSHGRLGLGNMKTQIRLFTEVTLPPRFTPEELVSCPDYTAVRCRDQMLLAGRNHHGQLGLGQATDDIVNYTQAPFPAVRAWCMSDFTVFLSGDRLLYAGKVGMLGSRFLHGLTECPAAVPLNLPWPVKGAVLEEFVWAFIRADNGTSCGTWHSGGTLVKWELGAEVTGMKTNYDNAWLKTEAGWHGLGMNWDEELGVHGPTVVSVPTPVEWVTSDFRCANIVPEIWTPCIVT